MFENLIGKECIITYATFGDVAYDAKGIIKSAKDDFIIVERKSDFIYIAIKAIVTIVIKK